MRNIKELTDLFGIGDRDAKAIAIMKKPVADRLDDMVEDWYEWLSTMPEHDEFFDSNEKRIGSWAKHTVEHASRKSIQIAFFRFVCSH